MLQVFAALSLGATAALKATTFGRWGLPGEPVAASAVDIVNVLGRWQTCRQWDTIGELKKMDLLFDASGNPKAALNPLNPSFATLYTGQGSERFKDRPQKYWAPDPRVAPSPQRRGFCLRQGLVARYWHSQNVGLLKFTSEPLAASVGCTVRELNALPIDPMAATLVFDALARSQAGTLSREECDARRASYQDEAGAFNAATFGSDLLAARLTVARAYSPIVVLGGALFSKLDGAQGFQDYVAQSMVVMGKNADLWADALSLGR